MESVSDGINELLAPVHSQMDAPVYDLTGRRVEVMKQGGMYIRGGKKFICRQSLVMIPDRERLGGFWWCKGMLFILRKDFGESMCEVSAKRVCMITLLSLSHFMQKVWKQR